MCVSLGIVDAYPSHQPTKPNRQGLYLQGALTKIPGSSCGFFFNKRRKSTRMAFDNSHSSTVRHGCVKHGYSTPGANSLVESE